MAKYSLTHAFEIQRGSGLEERREERFDAETQEEARKIARVKMDEFKRHLFLIIKPLCRFSLNGFRPNSQQFTTDPQYCRGFLEKID